MVSLHAPSFPIKIFYLVCYRLWLSIAFYCNRDYFVIPDTIGYAMLMRPNKVETAKHIKEKEKKKQCMHHVRNDFN